VKHRRLADEIETMSWTFLFAVLSASSRAALNLFDRHMYGTRRRSVYTTMVLNLALPLAVCLALVFIMQRLCLFGSIFASWATLIPAAVIQLVSYAYANAFKRSPILNVVVCSKIGELLIPIALLPWTGVWRPSDYVFYVLAFVAIVPMIRRRNDNAEPSVACANMFHHSLLWVVGATILQAVVFQLHPPGIGYTAIGEAFLYHTGVLAWRVIMSIAIMLLQPRSAQFDTQPLTMSDTPWLVARGLCFVATQVTFIAALQQPDAYLVWPALNATSLLSALAASWLLEERLNRGELLSLMLLTSIVVARIMF
jgi:uncharacterized membrane protein